MSKHTPKNTTAHTPGPWFVGTKQPYRICVCVDGHYIPEREQFVVSFGGETGGNGWPAMDYEVIAANARLIASAPALLAAAEKASAWIAAGMPAETKNVHADLDAAIAAARGGVA